MKFTLSWLHDHLNTDWSAKAIADKLTDIGLELEELIDNSTLYAPFVIARIDAASQHPDAERLRVCSVNTGSDVYQVVCGAPNAIAGLIGVFAPPGSVIPGTGMALKVSKIRGVESHGMLCSERELNISDEHDGIIDLADPDLALGMPYAEYAALNDPVFDIAITPNRGDCLSVRGIARDLAAGGVGTLKPLQIPHVEGEYASPIAWQRSDDIGDDCPYVAGRHIRSVTNGPSPVWMQQRLQAIGLRPISALVDITNYVTYDLGRPLHVFDADKVHGNVTIKKAQKGEELVALDGKNYQLQATMTIIADDNEVLSIGGIMGGQTTRCQLDTTNVFVESALFDPINVATTGRTLNILSDARYRFERGIDTHSADLGVHVATQWIESLCGGTPSKITNAGKPPHNDQQIALRFSQLRNMGGVDIAPSLVQEILQNLGFTILQADDTRLCVSIPSWRPDIEGEHCLCEEILRIYGFSNVVAVSLPKTQAMPTPILSSAQRRIANLRRKMASLGLLEVVSWSFIDEQSAKLFGGGDPQLQLQNPIHTDLSHMRPNLLPNLLIAATNNRDRGYGNVALFEIGPIFKGHEPEDQHTHCAMMRMGTTNDKLWIENDRKADVFDIKADCEQALADCGVATQNLLISKDNLPSWYHPARSGALCLGNRPLAHFGELHPKVAKHYGLTTRVVIAEVYPLLAPIARARNTKHKPLVMSAFQPVFRDFAFVCDKITPAQDLIRAIHGVDKKLITDVRLFDVYTGADLGDKISLAIRVTLQASTQTLQEEQIDDISTRIIAAANKRVGAELRT